MPEVGVLGGAEREGGSTMSPQKPIYMFERFFMINNMAFLSGQNLYLSWFLKTHGSWWFQPPVGKIGASQIGSLFCRDRGNNKGSHAENTLVNPPPFVAGQPYWAMYPPPPENYSKALSRVC